MAASHDEGGVDWRRLASDRNVAHTVARGLWEHARATSRDAAQAERTFHVLLDEAAAANATHEPGRETLVDAKGTRDAASLGPGKSTRVLEEQKSPKLSAADGLRKDLLAAVEAGKAAVELLTSSDPATIAEALRELRAQEGAGLLQKLMTAAGGAIERILDAQQKSAKPVGVDDDLQQVQRRRRRAEAEPTEADDEDEEDATDDAAPHDELAK